MPPQPTKIYPKTYLSFQWSVHALLISHSCIWKCNSNDYMNVIIGVSSLDYSCVSISLIRQQFANCTCTNYTNGLWMACQVIWNKQSEPGSRFNIKVTSYQYRKSHSGDRTVLRQSYLHNGISCSGKMTSLYWIGVQTSLIHGNVSSDISTKCIKSTWSVFVWSGCRQGASVNHETPWFEY